MIDIVILVKVDEMYNILNSVLATVWCNSHINVSFVETSLNKWVHFQHVLASRELQQIAYVICKINGWKIPEHIVADVYSFMLLYL